MALAPATPSSHSTRISSRSPSPSPTAPSRRISSSASSQRPINKITGGSITPSTTSVLPPHLSSLHLLSDSSASSFRNINVVSAGSEGILLKETMGGNEADDMEEGGSGMVEMDEATRKALRDQLRKTLSSSSEDNEDTRRSSSATMKGKGKEIPHEIVELEPIETVPSYPPRQYFVLTDGGKPVFISRTEFDDSEIATIVGVMQALISVFIDNNDKLRCIVAGSTRISFLLKSPLYYVCVSKWREPESVTRSHLEYLHMQILSIVTGAQLRRIFERRTNFDIGRLLSGAETFLHSLIDRLEFDLAISTSSLLCLNLDATLRSQIGECLIPSSKISKDILYVLLIARGRVVTLIRPKKHSVHPADLHILLNTIHVPSILNSQASWLPLCLPRYNANGFLHAYVNFLRNDDIHEINTNEKAPSDLGTEKGADTPRAPSPSSVSVTPPQHAAEDNRRISLAPTSDGNKLTETEKTVKEDRGARQVATARARRDRLGIGLVCVSAGRDFDTIRVWFDEVVQKLESEQCLDSICREIRSGKIEYKASQLAIPGLRHFIYKNRSQVQATLPVWEEPYRDDLDCKRRLITLYQTIYDALYAKSGQTGPLKLQYIKTKHEAVLGWITRPFELYLAVSPELSKSAVISAANAVVKWVQRNESRLFLRDAPTF